MKYIQQLTPKNGKMVNFMLCIFTTVKKKRILSNDYELLRKLLAPLIYGLYFTTSQVFVNC